MKRNFPYFLIAFMLLQSPFQLLSQVAPNLNSLSNFSLFTSKGAITITSSQVSGKVGSDTGYIDYVGSSSGQTYNNDVVTDQAATDLSDVYSNLVSQQHSSTLPILLGNGQTLTSAVYLITAASTLNGKLTLDAQNNLNAVFIIKIDAAFTSNADAIVELANGAQACNVFWSINGATTLGTNTIFKGNIIGNGAYTLGSGTVLEGRALTIFDAITVTASNITSPTSCNTVILPIQLLSFDGAVNGTKANLTWTTSSESNSDYFAIEESSDLTKWTVLTTVKAAGFSNTVKNYSATDLNLHAGFNYYRLKQVDLNGTSRYYKTLSLKANNSTSRLDISVYPNPTFGQFNITIAVDKSSTAHVQILDMAGRSISVETFITKQGINTFSKSVNNLPSGSYLLKVTTDDGLKTKYFVKQ